MLKKTDIMQYRYGLQKYKDRDKSLVCPKCGRHNCFTPYIDNQTGEVLNAKVGICNHKNSCGYHYSPKQYFEDNRLYYNSLNQTLTTNTDKMKETSQNIKVIQQETHHNTQNNNTLTQVKRVFSDYRTPYNQRRRSFLSTEISTGKNPVFKPSSAIIANTSDSIINSSSLKVIVAVPEYISYQTLLSSPFKTSLPEFILRTAHGFLQKEDKDTESLSLTAGGCHNLAEALIRKRLFSLSDISDANEYLDVCASNNNGTLYYQLDLLDRVRTAKIISYDKTTGHRIKDFGANWLHSQLIRLGYLKQDFTLRQVIFGLRNLKNRFLCNENVKICVYEAEKTAYIMTLKGKEGYCHAAVGGRDLLKTDMLLPLKELGVKKLTLYPDKGCYSIWNEKARKTSVELNIDIRVSKYLETTNLDDGADMADLFC